MLCQLWFPPSFPLIIRTIEIPNMEAHGMKAMVGLACLPSKAIAKDSPLNLLHKQRIKNWRDAIYAQLDATGLFTPKEASVPA